MGNPNNKHIFYTYWDTDGKGINTEYLENYNESLIFDSYNRTIYAKDGIFGNKYMNSYHGEVFNDFYNNVADGDYSSAHGHGTVANNDNETAVGKYNVSIPDTTLFTVGNGTDKNNRSNAIAVTKNGDLNVQNDISAQNIYLEKKLLVKDPTTQQYINIQKSINSIDKLLENNVEMVHNISNGFYNGKYYVWVGTSAQLPSERYKNVIYVVTDGTPTGDVYSYDKEYMTFEVVNDGTITWKANSTNNTKTISYSTDNGSTWTSVTSSKSGVSLGTFTAGQKVLIKGTNTAYGTSNYYNYFSGTAKVNVYGNIMSLIYGDNFTNQTTLPASYTFKYLFNGYSNLLSAEYLVLPATTLTNYCYDNMFRGCTSLVTAPELPATTLANYCYDSMFYKCTSLTTAPELPATTLANSCYYYMFYGCSSLVTAPELPATTLANNCYSQMFMGCTSLVTAPELPATTLANYCYFQMFQSCSSLVTAPELPATTLADSCYFNMFMGCTSLVTAPELPATTLANSCYYCMFQACTSLVTAPELPATKLANYCYYQMFMGCTSLNNIICLATDISATNCTNNWVTNVSATGTFSYREGTVWSSGYNGIPENWVEHVIPYNPGDQIGTNQPIDPIIPIIPVQP